MSNEHLKNQNTPKLFALVEGDIWVIVPAYNEENIIGDVLKELLSRGLKLVVVDDGSTDGTYKIAQDIIEDNQGRGYLYHHPVNRGLGATLKTGIEACLRKNADIMVTFDADGQHNPDDILPVCQPIIKGQADVVIGVRDFDDMPGVKKISNQLMNLITWMFYGSHVQDSQSGLRAFNRKAAIALDVVSREYGISSEIIREIKHKELRMEEVPIETIYTEYALAKGTNLKVGIKILVKMIRDVLK
ncbi:MAG: Glycosyltransferase AglJ [Methanobacterium sp. PtaU1.Bin242]|jgi:glycosyltransferase involved in cell wall biosynthesis|nr:MAG: Glycosyltransferase AglJ [Methanobacterium sp. PtaU1.Bin242]